MRNAEDGVPYKSLFRATGANIIHGGTATPLLGRPYIQKRRSIRQLTVRQCGDLP